MISRIIHSVFYFLSIFPVLVWGVLTWMPGGNISSARIVLVALLCMSSFPLIWVLRLMPREKSEPTSHSHLALFAACVAIGSAVFFWRAYVHPHGMTDAWQMWNAKGKYYFVFFELGRDFRLAEPTWFHPGYPPLLPFQLAGLALLIGHWSFWIPMILAFVYYLLICVVFFDLVRRLATTRPLAPRTYSDFAGLLLCAFPLLPAIILAAAEQCADIPLSAFLVYVYFLACFKIPMMEKDFARPAAYFVLLGIASGAILHIKNEGFILAMMFLPVFFWMHRKELREWKNALSVLIGPLVAVTLLVLYKNRVPELQPYHFTLKDLGHDLVDPSRYIFIIKGAIAFQLITVFFAPVVTLCLVWKYRRSRVIAFLPLVANFIFYHFFFLITPEDLPWHWVSAYHRITEQTLPAWFFLTALTLGLETSPSPDLEIVGTGRPGGASK